MAELSVIARSEDISLQTMMFAASTRTLVLGAVGRVYRVRAYCRGRDKILQAVAESEDTPRGVEQYLIQLWPA